MKSSCLVILMFLGLFTPGMAQHIHGNDLNPSLQKKYKKALQYKRTGKSDKALKLFERIIKKEPGHTKSYLQIAGIYYGKDQYQEAEQYLLKAIAIDPDYDQEMYYSLGLIQEKLKEREKALENFKLYVLSGNRDALNFPKAINRINNLEFIILAMNNPVPFDPVDPGPAINTGHHEYLATVDVTGEFMVFSRRIDRQEDLFTSSFENGEWQKAKPIIELNTLANEAAHCLSPDGQSIYFTSCDNKKTFGSCDIFQSDLINGKWSKAKNLGTSFNTGSWDAQPSISADGKTIYFSSTRPGGKGGRDIWTSTRQRDGNWSSPVNLGEKINTKGNEEAPYLYPDGKRLYFMSDNHVGMGGFDLFVSEKTGGRWSKPMNLGYPINTEKDEGALRVAADGQTAYFSSDRLDISGGKRKDLNIYSFILPEFARAPMVSYIQGKVIDKDTEEPMEVSIFLVDNLTGEQILQKRTDNEGAFLIALPAGFDYNLSINEVGYVYHSEHFELIEGSLKEDNNLLIELQPLKTDSIEAKHDFHTEFILENIFFESGSAQLDFLRSHIELNNLAEFLLKNNGLKIRIEGHTDNVGEDSDNILLSEQRAKNVFEFLLGTGIQKDRLEFKGFGEQFPIATNETEIGRQKNRRTSFKIINP